VESEEPGYVFPDKMFYKYLIDMNQWQRRENSRCLTPFQSMKISDKGEL
jgi:hypothetical protein